MTDVNMPSKGIVIPPFGELQNFSAVSLKAKLIFFRSIIHSIRWRLEVKRMEAPNHKLADQLRQVPTFKGGKGSVEELQSLYEQAQFLAGVLDRWNSDAGEVQDILLASVANN